MHVEPEAPHLRLPVVLEGPAGETKLDMALDTGATFLIVSPAAARTIGLDSLASPWVPMTTASASATAPFVRVPSVRALGRRVHHVEALCLALPPESGVDGLLGLSFLRHLDIDLYLRSGWVRARNRRGG